MTVQNTTPAVTHLGTGVQTSFPFTFRADDVAWLSVDFVTNFDQFIINADQENNPGGTAEYLVAPPLNQELTILRDTTRTQELDYTRYDPFDSESHEGALDKLTMIVQELNYFVTTGWAQNFDDLANVDFASKVDGSMIYWDDGAGNWMDTAAQVRYLGGQFEVDADSVFRGNVSFEANASSVSGNFYRWLSPTNIRFADMAATDAPNRLAITTANLADFVFVGFSGRVMQDAETLAYVSELPVLINDHTLLLNIGVNTHAQIDTHIADGTIHFSEASIDHTAISNIGVNSHGVIDSHIANASIHFVQTAIDHTVIANVGVNTHAQIDAAITTLNSHIADATIHYVDAPADGMDYVRRDNLWFLAAYTGVPDHGTLPGLGDPDHDQYRDGTLPWLGDIDVGGFGINDTFQVNIDRINNEQGITIDGDVGNATNPAIGMLFLGLNSYRRIMAWGEAGAYQFFMDADLTAAAAVQELVFGSVTNATMLQLREDGLMTIAGAYSLPIADGAAGEVLTTDGLGTLTFQPGGGGVTDHFLLTNIGVNTHVQIDSHIADATIHFTEASIDHTAISSIGVNSHAAIDAHIADGTIHFTEASIDHGSIAGLGDDDHAQYILDGVGRAGIQDLIGGLAANDVMSIEATSNAARGTILTNSAIQSTFDWTTGTANYPLRWNPTIAASGGIITAFMDLAANVTVNNGLFILSALDTHNILTWTVTPGFSITTTFFGRDVYVASTAGIPQAQAYVYAAQHQFQNNGAGNISVSNYRGFSFSPILRAIQAGDAQRITNTTGLSVGPLSNTNNAGATVDFGTIRGVHMVNASTVIFGQSLGLEEVDDWIGVDCEAMTGLTVNTRRAAVRSAIVSGADNRFLENTGGAASDFGAGSIYFNDLAGVRYGGVGIASPDWQEGWLAAGFKFEQEITGAGGQFRKNFPAAGRMLMDWSADTELNINCVDGFSLGAQTGGNGNQFGNFVAGARTTAIAGEWSDFLLTQAANLTVNQANMNVFSWTINATSITLSGPGTVLTNAILNIGGNPGTATVNRVGVRILSNPSGGSGVNAALWLTAGRARFDGPVDINAPIALGGGAAATLGTIGGSGPTAAAQAQWVQVEINGVNHWIPAWT